MAITELRFPAHGPRGYAQGLGLSVLGIGFIAWGAATLAVTPWRLLNAVPLTGGCFLILVGLAFVLFVWFTVACGTIATWRRWRQFGRPAVVVDSAGVHYLASKRPTVVPWPDIEQLSVKRSVYRASVMTNVFLRLQPGAALLRDGVIPVLTDRQLAIGLMAKLSVSEDAATEFLAELAGARLKMTEIDRRPTTVGARAR